MTNTDNQTDSFVNSGTSPPAALTAEHKRSDYIAEGFKNRTKGEAKFNFSTYFGLGYVGSLAASLALTWFVRDSKLFAPTYEKWARGLAKFTQGKKTGDALISHEKSVNSLMTIFSMFAGTTLMAILPIKWLEDNKPELIKKYDREIYGEERVANDPEIQQAHALIDAAPKQTWKSVIGSRLLAFAATMGVAHFVGSNESWLGKAHGISIDKWSIGVGRWLDKTAGGSKAAEHIARAATQSPHDLTRAAPHADRTLTRISSYLALDGLYTFMTGGVLYVFTRILAPMFDKNLHARESALSPELRASIGRDMVRPPLTKHEKPSTAVVPTPATTISAPQLDSERLAPAPELAASH